MKVPGHREVDRALVQTIKELDRAVTALNRQAGGLVTKGSYESAEALLTAGREMTQFRAKLTGLREEWKALLGTTAVRRQDVTPLWKYYQPILRVLAELGGTGSRRDVEERVFELLQGELLPADLDSMARGVPRWKVMVRRSRRHIAKEGFIEAESGPWKLTPAGERAAKKPGIQLAKE